MSQDERTHPGDLDGATIPPETDPDPNPPQSGALRRGQSLGHYLIIEQIGQGGMGVVYAAYDQDLDRKVAIKLLKQDTRGEELPARQDRLMREARAMARLSNPHVNTVHEVGAFQGQLYLVMELIEGQTLGAWLSSAPRTWRQVVDVFQQAGRGLAAAHRAGLIHRDVKPDNLLVGTDGRVRVTDFGLVSAAGPAPAASDPRPAALDPDSALTRTGAVLGSPAYMSPEQHGGQPLTAASDQFSFCVSLFEALYGQRPFRGESLDEISEQIRSAELPASPAQAAAPGKAVRDAPAHLYALLRRGLDPDPDRRFVDMDALLAELARDPARARKRVLAWAAAAGALAVGIGGLVLGLAGGPEPCAHPARHLEGIWDQATRASLATAFQQTGLGHAPATWARVEHQIDAYTAAWVRTRREACEATQVHQEQSAALMDLRMRCLDRHLADVQALLQVLAKPDFELVDHAYQAAAALGDLTACSDGEALRNRVPPPSDPEGQRKLAEAEQVLAEARARLRAGRYEKARERALEATARSDALAHRPLQAEAWLVLGECQAAMKDLDAAEGAFRRAIQYAEAGRHDRLAAQAWGALVNTVGNLKGQIPAGTTQLAHARASLERLGGDPALESDLLLYSGQMHQNALDLQAAQRDVEQALEIRTRLYGSDHLRVAGALSYLAAALRKRSTTENDPALIAAALAAQRRCFEITKKALGEGHPRVAQAMSDLAGVLDIAGQTEESLALQAQAIEIWSKALPDDHPALANAYNRMASAHLTAGRVDRAIDLMERALAVRTRAFGPTNPETADIHFNLGVLHNQKGEMDRAQAQFEQAAAGYQSAQGPASAKGAMALYAVCGMLRMKGKLEEGLSRCQQSLAIWEQTGAKHKGHLARTLVAIGQAQLGLGRPAEAITPLQRALALHGEYKPPPLEVAEARFELARALWDSARDKPRARTLAAQAWSHFKGDRDAPKDQRAEVAAWIKARGGR